MADYIDRQEVIETVAFYREDPDGIDHALQSIKSIPAADVQPVKHGEWTAEGNDEYGNYWDECTACRNAVFFPPSVKNDYKYCPHCGAVMDGAE